LTDSKCCSLCRRESYARTSTTELRVPCGFHTFSRANGSCIHCPSTTPEQLQSAKNYIKGQFGPSLQTNDQLASTLCEIEFYGLGSDYINTFFDSIDAVTLPEARRVIQSYFPLNENARPMVLFGSHLYGRPVGGTETTLPRITRQDIVSFHAAHYVPNEMLLAVAGDFSTADLELRLREKFGSWKRAQAAQPALEPPSPVHGLRALIIDKPDATQTFFRFGNIGLARANKDWVDVQVVNTLFGGRFTSIINSELRIKSGLTYGARSRFGERRLPGPFDIASYTPNESTGRAMELALGVLHKFHDQEEGLVITADDSFRDLLSLLDSVHLLLDHLVHFRLRERRVQEGIDHKVYGQVEVFLHELSRAGGVFGRRVGAEIGPDEIQGLRNLIGRFGLGLLA
jgi:predicted Zn-dependent peptidase